MTRTSAGTTVEDADGPGPQASAEVALIGRLGTSVTSRELPSGDVVTVFTVVVDRDPRQVREGGPRVDAIPCQTTKTVVARRVSGWEPGDWIHVSGTLRRRFWRSSSGLGSAMEVDARAVGRVRR